MLIAFSAGRMDEILYSPCVDCRVSKLDFVRIDKDGFDFDTIQFNLIVTKSLLHPRFLPFHSAFVCSFGSISNSSSVNTRVARGGIRGGNPWCPYPYKAGMVASTLWPTHMLWTATSIPSRTCCLAPSSNRKARSWESAIFVPFSRKPWNRI